ncbi:MAG: hypothetical protein WCR67_02980, partial [Bacilli bacterium]
KVAHAGGVMQSFERLGCTWTSAYKPINTQVLRNEWGFIGNIVTDATNGSSGGYKSRVVECLDSGTQQFCLDYTSYSAYTIMNQITDTDDGHLLNLLLKCAKDWEYAISRTTIINGLTPSSEVVNIITWWKITIVSMIALFSVTTTGLITYLFIFSIKKKKEA